RRFTWNVGSSAPLQLADFHSTVDFGFGGSKFNRGITWTPAHATFIDANGNPARLRVLGDNQLGSNFVDFLAGIKVRVAERLVMSGAVNVPINDEGFRAAAVGTFALEVYL